MKITWPKELTTPGNVSFQGHDRLRKIAGLFAGMNHMQPLLLATTNSNYLLDRFCMERCCSSEYISRIVISLIFMEVMATLLVACFGVYIACTYSSNLSGKALNDWNEDYEEKWRGRISSGILWAIMLGYIQILISFTTGGKKGHMHWFYASLMIQQFVCLLIGGAIGFWEGGVTLWYLMAIPMGPIPVFFYQMIIHSWIRNNGPRYPEYIVVENQIWLAILLSSVATTLWINAYATPYYPIELNIATQGSNPSADRKRINAGPITLQTAYSWEKPPLTKNDQSLSGLNLGSEVNVKSVELSAYSLTLTTAKISTGNNYVVNLTVKAELTIVFSAQTGTVKVTSAKITEQPKTVTLTTTPASSNPSIKVHSATANLKPNVNDKTVTLTIQSIKAGQEVTITSSSTTTVTIDTVEITIPVNLKVTPGGGGVPTTVPIDTVSLKLPAKPSTTGTEYSKDQKLDLSVTGNSTTLTIDVTAQDGGSGQPEDSNPKATIVKVDGKGFYPNKKGHCFYSVVDKGTDNNKRDIWANVSGKCSYVAFYYNKTKALLTLYHRNGEHVEKMYFGTNDTSVNARDPWKEISEADFKQNLEKLANKQPLTLGDNDGTTTDQYNRKYNAIWPNVWFPLVMHGMAVGAVGSIFPNLIPKTLTCPRTSRTLSVINMFMVTVPHIFNVMLGDMDLLGWIGVGDDWTNYKGWTWAYSLYLFYILAILFAIFNIHYPEWKATITVAFNPARDHLCDCNE